MSSESEIINAMKALDEAGTEIIVISRGGGENLELFNKTSIAQTALELKSLFVTAIGHKDDMLNSRKRAASIGWRYWSLLSWVLSLAICYSIINILF